MSKGDEIDVLSSEYILKKFSFDIKRLELNASPLFEKRGTNTREVVFSGTYQNLDINCECIIFYGDLDYLQEQYIYSFKMYQKLYGCRNMSNYIGLVRAHVPDVVDFLKVPPTEPAIFVVRSAYEHPNLNRYLKSIRKNELYIEPLYLLQMCISLFCILNDAHECGVGLVDLKLDSFEVDFVGTLYFNNFQSCMDLNDAVISRKKYWMVNTKNIKCPEQIKKTYKKETDVYQASLIMLELVKDFNAKIPKLYTIDHKNQVVRIERRGIDNRHLVMADIIEQGLSYDPKNRPTASAILYALISSRQKSLNAGSKKKRLV